MVINLLRKIRQSQFHATLLSRIRNAKQILPLTSTNSLLVYGRLVLVYFVFSILLHVSMYPWKVKARLLVVFLLYYIYTQYTSTSNYNTFHTLHLYVNTYIFRQIVMVKLFLGQLIPALFESTSICIFFKQIYTSAGMYKYRNAF